MHRHEMEPSDAEQATRLRHGDEGELTPVPPTAKAVFFGASYHADYATILGAPDDLPAVASAVVDQLAKAGPDEASDLDPDHASPGDGAAPPPPRGGAPGGGALAPASGPREPPGRCPLTPERGAVCPVVPSPGAPPFADYLGPLEKKSRH